SMAVRAPHFAFVDLASDCVPRDGSVGESAHVPAFVAQMIEIEQVNVGLTAVHAWMSRQVLAHPETQLCRVTIAADSRSCDLSLSIARVPLVCVGPLAHAADPLASLFLQRAKRKLC